MRREGKKLTRVARLYAGGQLTFAPIRDHDHEVPDEQNPHGGPDQGDGGGNGDTDSVDHALAVFGLRRVDVPPPTRPRKCYLWPCHGAVFRLWCAVQTQWRYRPAGMAGAVPCGLDYAGVESASRGLGIRGKAYADLFPLLQVMERAAVAVYAAQANASA